MTRAHRLQAWLERRWYGAAPAGFLSGMLLALLASLFAGLSALRRALYRRGWLASAACAVPVVVVGNIAVGGSGKTPFIIALAEALRRRGWKPGVISRGYGRSGVDAVRVHAEHAAEQVGDEPLLIARTTGVPVAVASRRIDAARLLMHDTDIDVLLSDDGMQHYALRRDVEIALIDGQRGLGNARLMPAGPLREPVGRLERCDWVFALGAAVEAAPRARVYHGSLGRARRLHDGVEAELETFRGRRVAALAGIADPERFFRALEAQGIEVERWPFPDHHAFSASELQALAGARVLMTEKDAARIDPRIEPGADRDWWSVAWTIELPADFVGELDTRLRDSVRRIAQTSS